MSDNVFDQDTEDMPSVNAWEGPWEVEHGPLTDFTNYELMRELHDRLVVAQEEMFAEGVLQTGTPHNNAFLFVVNNLRTALQSTRVEGAGFTRDDLGLPPLPEPEADPEDIV